MGKQRMRRVAIRVATIAIGLLVAALGVGLLEFGAMKVLEHDGQSRGAFLIDREAWARRFPSYQQAWGQELVVSYLDPQLGFAANPNGHPLLHGTRGFVSYRSGDHTGPLPRIIALGGSTTDPLTGVFLGDSEVTPADPANWPRQLAAILGSRNLAAEVLNGGVAGYSSNQELLKFIRDALPLRPRLVICLNGVNEVGFVHSVPGHPMVHPYQRKMLEDIARSGDAVLLPNISRVVRGWRKSDGRQVEGVNLGTRNTASPAAQWEVNFRTMHAVATEFGITHVVVLQPILGYGPYQMSPEESALLEARGEQYRMQVRTFYDEARVIAAKYPYCLDLSDCFADETNVYLDPRHQNAHGVEVLARAIHDELQARGLLAGLEREPR